MCLRTLVWKRTLPLASAVTCLAISPLGVATGQMVAQQPAAVQQSPQATSPPSATQPPAQHVQPPPENVVAVVNNDPITKQEFQASLQPHIEANPQLDPTSRQQLQQQVLNSLIDSRLVEQHMLENGPKVPQEEIDTVATQIKEQVGSQGASYEQFLSQRGQTEDSMTKRIAGTLAWNKFCQEKVTEEQLQKYYQENQQQFEGLPYEQARPQISQMFTVGLWKGVAQQARPAAEIEVVQPAAPAVEAPPEATVPQSMPAQ